MVSAIFSSILSYNIADYIDRSKHLKWFIVWVQCDSKANNMVFLQDIPQILDIYK